MGSSILRTWKHKGVVFVAFARRGEQAVHVVDEHGNNYGSWLSAERFRSRQAKGDELTREPCGKCLLSHEIVSVEQLLQQTKIST